MEPEKSKCRSCGAWVFWLRNESTLKVSPIDAEPSPLGNCEVLSDSRFQTFGPLVAQLARNEGKRLHTNHFATCPQSKGWKKRK
jgi:hypothetical protein